MAGTEQIIKNQRVLAKALLYILWQHWPENPSENTREMRKELAKLAGEP